MADSAGELGDLSMDIAQKKHLDAEQFENAQEAIIDFDWMGSPVGFGQNDEQTIWQLAPELARHLKVNNRIKDRHLAGEDELAGNLKRVVPLSFEVMQQQNTFPFAVGLKMPGFMDANLHRNGACVWRVPCDTPTQQVGATAFKPNNIVTQYMYDNYKLCTLEELHEDCKKIAATGKTAAKYSVAVGSLAFEALYENRNSKRWADQNLDIAAIEEPADDSILVSERVGDDIIKLLEPPLKDVADSMLNFDEMTATMVRADGAPSFKMAKGIHGLLIGDQQVDGNAMENQLMTRNCSFHIKARIKYLLF